MQRSNTAEAGLTMGSLFRGIGGFDRGFEQAGIDVRWSVEIDEHCNAIARRHWPNVPIVKDVREAGRHNLPYVDVITFGSPCQDLSVAGKRRGLEGERSGLFYEAARIIREVGPKLAVWENVPGAFSSYTPTDNPPDNVPADSEWSVEEESDFTAVLLEMEKCGALDIGWRVLDSQWFGVAQRRRRILLVADFTGRRAAEILALSESLSGHPAPRRPAGEGVAGTIESRVGGGGFPSTDGACGNHVVPAVTSKWAKGAGGPSGDECQNLVLQPVVPAMALRAAQTKANGCGIALEVSHTLDRASGQAVALSPIALAYGISQEQTDKAFLEVMPTMKSRDSGGGQMQAVAIQESKQCGTAEFPTVGSLRVNAPGHQPCGSLLRTGMTVRKITPTECERLQGFEDGWTAWGVSEDGRRVEMSDTARYRMLGNAVTRTVAHWLGKRIKEAARRNATGLVSAGARRGDDVAPVPAGGGGGGLSPSAGA